ncbi:ABC transporter permease [Isobaculum melis]|uniref:ABC-2 family transporter protein n=1 Tax=Isobaculum melis TaxID=142588 RepID=A0A1H9SPU5_9LACT|nr:ABC transporter permease [Isobaculum melis]SER87030.1 hypothetical protein SAMN04488559_10890 [Isobaculum melis]
MQKLMKLEMKKHNMMGYWKGVVMSNIIIVAVMLLMIIGGKLSGESIFEDSELTLMSLNSTLLYATFIIFSAVVLARVVIEEYRNKMIQTLFTYPIARKKLMQAKLLIVFSFSVTAMIFSSIFQILAFSILNPLLNLVPEAITPAMLGDHFLEILLSAIAVAGIGLIPLFFGMLNKSTITTITSSVVIAVILTSNNGQGSLFQFAALQIGLSIVGIIIGMLSYRKINQIDVL